MSPSTISSTRPPEPSSDLLSWVLLGGTAYAVYVILHTAYRIRMGAIDDFGLVIHEFDPWFNYRATEYLYYNGIKDFFQWFDYMSWYPLGRPVGTTIYPGMQFTAVAIKRYLLDSVMSLNDICCYIPVWFGVMASGSTPLLLGFWSPAIGCSIFAMAMMAIVPAHLMRSMGGGYDNESIAVFAMVLTFYCWVRSLRSTSGSAHAQTYVAWSVATGLAYFYMVAAWGGYVFVLNLIGVHAAFLVLAGRFSTQTYVAYTLFYSIGTALAVQIPVVGWAPLKSLEQLGPGAVFLGYQLLYVCEVLRKRQNLTRAQAWKLRVQMCAIAGALVMFAAFFLAPKGYFGPLSSRVRGLFVAHTKTGNPLVDSVAEHQAASSRAYFQYLHHVCSLAPVGYILVFFNLSDASSFLIVWATAAYFFSHKMVRLILLTAPIGSILGGITAGPTKEKKKKIPKTVGKSDKYTSESFSSFEGLAAIQETARLALNTTEGILVRRSVALVLLLIGYFLGGSFNNYSWRLSQDLSNPTIIMRARLRDGQLVMIDDYREAYWWLKDNTPEDSRIMAWWDYGYQIAGIANRTSIADGNTWNHEHIALLGKALTTGVEEGYEIARHWADYVLLWTGGGGDDLAKSPHLARIANSVYRDHCPDDPTCRAFGFVDREGTPSAMMKRSFLFNLHGHQIKPEANAPADKFQEVFRSKYGKVRIFKILGVSQESKEWVADPSNRICDAPGSWFCRGQYPPGLSRVLEGKKDFSQLEDFNRGDRDEEYTRRYFEDLKDPDSARRKAMAKEIERNKEQVDAEVQEKKHVSVDDIYNTWENTDDTTRMWNLINSNAVEELKAWLEAEPHKAYVRSEDGRGPMWWAFEKRNEDVTKLLMKAGVPYTDRDGSGKTPLDLQQGG
ncbi:STT3 subunit-like protein [Phaeodactylum tricornutum CCAP 1055/1]|uniref:dolichyl-diphosphooligosaccharide--protein glycotransferase n=2 Tax=Phaeodactylum tricornutum TaxID=2850 RepID=B7GE39_PHATC|nr:STT3 subunit-like protein [Phaeodactylum tricornutum CCAP 1055/1]EEC43089.1 STT3 subunit-like protein [Phaeodactylum tricornutum CCAP 1055/1]|eukprot:XP_002185420.1 STT3 subunit-like protein [Phaeodactylum tricornutum CCAP 1055/1]